MATSGTTTFNLDIADVIEEAFDRCGLRLKTGYDLTTARRSLDLLGLEWYNRGTNFWTVEQISVTLTAGVATKTLENDTLDVIEALIREGAGSTQTDTPLDRVSVSVYANIPNKNTQGRPVNFWIDKQRDAPVMYLWPVPDVGTYSLVYYKLRRIEDAGAVATGTDPDVPSRFLPALVAGLASKIASKYPEAYPRLADLKAEYEEQWSLAVAGDRDRSSLRLIPGTGYF
jgi:hypothetical protein